MIQADRQSRSEPVVGLVMRTRPNWTVVVFLAGLATLHGFNATTAFAHHRFEGYLSTMFALLFTAATAVVYQVATELAVLPDQRAVRIRRGLRRLHAEQVILFEQVQRVRLTLVGHRRGAEGKIELLCDADDYECPPARYPRQQALFLAMAIGVPLIKVVSDSAPAPLDELRHSRLAQHHRRM